jgi:arylsulfatase A-like enzyme
LKIPVEHKKKEGVTLLKLFRLIFVVFSLYLLSVAFHRWDGFQFYAPFSEFIPAVSLVSILWTLTSLAVTFFIWVCTRFFEVLSERVGLKLKAEQLLFYGVLVILVGLAAWKVKRLIWPEIQTDILIKVAVLACVVLASLYIAWLFGNRAERLFIIVQERITPLVWLFGTFVLLSLPLVGFYSLKTEVEKSVPEEFPGAEISEADSERPNIILVTFDTLTARDMSAYGYKRDTTPFINKWAKNATVFRRAQAENNHTTPTTASLMTGKRVWTHQVYHQSGSIPLKNEIENLPKLLKESNYYNMAFIVNPTASARTLGVFDFFDVSPLMTEFYTDNRKLFDIYHGDIAVLLYKTFGDKIRLYNWILDRAFLGRLESLIMPKYKLMNPEISETVVPPEIAFNRFLEIYDDLPRPFFAWIHLLPPHSLYLPPAPYRGMFGPYFSPERYRALASGDDPMVMHDMRILYDEFIRYCDSQFEDFIIRLEKLEGQENSVIIFSSDHGESFEHDVYQHAVPALYEQLTHVPLIIKENGQKRGRIINDIVEQIDVPATILDMAHIPVPNWMDGRSLVPYMHGERLPQRPAFSMYFQQNRSRGHTWKKRIHFSLT